MPKQPRNHEPTIGIFDLLERTDTDEAQTTPLRGHPDLTLRDEANAITARVFRNGFLEDLHAGQWSPVLSGPGGSRITDAEMKKLMIETSARLAHWLYLRELLLDERPDAYFQLLSTMRRMFTHRWERRARTCDLPGAETRQATVCSCHASLYEGWRFCPLCGSVVVA
ncbi:MAG: hypothetical protein E6J71_13525 [Deltaproteobacteria bacterium]|nr:MAG: hypothetical protein E6J76_12085 [Deltaproteobacteria bacterium]TMB18027.1 MAG: hypothetical protein E6J71_13525 [Deltaproteobacteria bacterium]